MTETALAVMTAHLAIALRHQEELQWPRDQQRAHRTIGSAPAPATPPSQAVTLRASAVLRIHLSKAQAVSEADNDMKAGSSTAGAIWTVHDCDHTSADHKDNGRQIGGDSAVANERAHRYHMCPSPETSQC